MYIDRGSYVYEQVIFNVNEQVMCYYQPLAP